MKGLRTKADRLKYLDYEFNRLTESGYKKETYKDLYIFTNTNDQILLKVFSGTSTNAICFFRYSTIERMQEKIKSLKESADYCEKRKLENGGKKREQRKPGSKFRANWKLI